MVLTYTSQPPSINKSLLVPSIEHHLHHQAYQAYIITFTALDKDIINAILSHDALLSYKNLHNVITEDERWKMIEHHILHLAPHQSGKVKDLQKQIYDLQVIFTLLNLVVLSAKELTNVVSIL